MQYTLQFEWYAVPGAVSYTIHVAEDEAFEPLVAGRSLEEQIFRIDVPAPGAYWWRVRGVGPEGTPGPWSEARKLNVAPPPLAASVHGITVTPPAVAPGEGAEALVTLLELAPPGGVSVFVRADGRGVRLPARVIVPAGSASATFRVTTDPGTAPGEVRISAVGRQGSKTAALAIHPERGAARISSFTVHPAVMSGGGTALATVALATPAPVPLAIRISTSDSGRAPVPETVRIPRGARLASFPVQTAHDNTPAVVELSAALDGNVRTARINLNGAGSMNALPAPGVLGPTQGATVSRGAAVEFAWSNVAGAASYTIEVDDSDIYGTSAVGARTVPGATLPLSFQYAGTVRWRVRANDAYGAPGAWSAWRTLRVR